MVVELSDEEAKLFVEFRKYQDQFIILLAEGVFDDYLGYKEIHKNGHIIKMVVTTITKRIILKDYYQKDLK